MPSAPKGYRGRVVVIDPDTFAVGDIWELLSGDMRHKAILCRRRAGPKGAVDRCLARGVMLLVNARLKHWAVREEFERMFTFEQDYQPWVYLKDEPRETIGLPENASNDFDRLDDHSKVMHKTRRRTQPWKAGLPIDWRPAEEFRLSLRWAG